MATNTARKIRGPNVPDDFKVIRESSAKELDALFSQATADAARQAMNQGVAVTGIDERGRVVLTPTPINLDSGLQEPHKDFSPAK